jgi:hypothetical protein
MDETTAICTCIEAMRAEGLHSTDCALFDSWFKAARRADGELGYWECINGIPYCRHCDICGYPRPCGRDHSGED